VKKSEIVVKPVFMPKNREMDYFLQMVFHPVYTWYNRKKEKSGENKQ
jgi:hypothetical protein